MWQHVIPILGFVLLCMLWGLFQLWLRRVGPNDTPEEDRCTTCGGCNNKGDSGRE